jgi:cytochrome c
MSGTPARSTAIATGVAMALAVIATALSGPRHLLAQAQRVSTAATVVRPDENRFGIVTLIPYGELDEGVVFSIAKDGRVFVIERRLGNLKVYDPLTAATSLVATFPVNHTYTSAAGKQTEAEEGLIGFTLDPKFDRNHFAYVLYADVNVTRHVLARIELRDGADASGNRVTTVVPQSQKTMLEYGTQREVCCHTGGGMTWDANGNLYITVGNNTGENDASQTDERPGHANWDDSRAAANTNDLRGKILRIHPEPDGSYTIPAGNLFPAGTPKTRPEIFTMGNRNPWRPSLDSATGWLYWGEVGPDIQVDSKLGPQSYDEFNQAKKPGFFGWPYFVGENRAYPYWDYATDSPRPPKDPDHPTNTSPNNTGLVDLPPTTAPLVAYPHILSEKYPELGAGGSCAVGGPVYRRADFSADAPRPWPAYYEGKWLVTDCSRGWIVAISMNPDGSYKSMERVMPHAKFAEPIDMKFGPDGDLYLLDYGSTWFAKSADARLVRIEYHAGNRPPHAVASASRTGGTAPLQVALSSAGTTDFDGDPITYQWTVTSAGGGAPRVFRQANPSVTFDRNGIYTATLSASDSSGARDSASVTVIVGNEPPAIAIDTTGANKTFFKPGAPISYTVRVTDKEDGTPPADRIALSIDDVPEGFDVESVKQGQKPVDATTRFAVAKALMAKTNCAFCHNPSNRTVGPTYKELAAKYQPDDATLEKLAAKVRAGGSGNWGTVPMPSHPLLSVSDAKTIVRYFLSVNDPAIAAAPLSGSFTPANPQSDGARSAVLIHAAYTDKGAGQLPAQTSEALMVLRNPTLGADTADVESGVLPQVGRGSTTIPAVVPTANAFIAFKGIDMTGVRSLALAAQAGGRTGGVGGTIEVRLDSPTGELIGSAVVAVPAQGGRGGGGGGRGGASPPIAVELKSAAGRHDVYFVFKNDRATPTQPLMTLATIAFGLS